MDRQPDAVSAIRSAPTGRSAVPRLAGVVLMAAGVLAGRAGADITNFVIFGDSLSDTGNALARTVANGFIVDRPQNPFYSTGRWTGDSQNTGVPDPNNPNQRIPTPALRLGNISAFTGVWHEALARRLTINAATDSEGGGRNYAYGGAVANGGTFGDGTFLNVGDQLMTRYLNNPRADTERTLFVMWAGGNDIRDAAIANGATRASVLAAADTAAANIRAYIQCLKECVHPNQSVAVLWPNLPPLGAIPDAQRLAPAIRTAMNDASARFRDLQTAAVADLRAQFPEGPGGLNVLTLDVHTLFGDLIAGRLAFRPANATDNIVTARDAFGNSSFSSATFSPIRNNGVADGINPDTYVFWDQVHPTARVHDLIGAAAFSAVPAPGAAILLVLGGLVAARRRRG